VILQSQGVAFACLHSDIVNYGDLLLRTTNKIGGNITRIHNRAPPIGTSTIQLSKAQIAWAAGMAAERRSSMKKPTSAARIAANRLNGKKGNGPKDTHSSRFNSAKHGLLAAGVTELDNLAGYRDTLRDLKREKNPMVQDQESCVLAVAGPREVVRARTPQRTSARLAQL
jgi:hypothetical protein